MQGQFDTAMISHIKPIEPTIRKGDLISIIVFSDNPTATKLYNQSVIPSNSSSSTVGISGPQAGASTTGVEAVGNSPAAPGYQVDNDGNIIFQGLGLLHVEGLTKAKLKDTLDARLTQFLKNPYYSIRFLNYKFTMLGEISRPGIISIPGERINLLEALALAGDMTFYGRRDNILVIRDSNGIKKFVRLNLLKPEIMASPYFYLQQNDVIIVEATKKKAVASDQVTVRNVSLAATIVSTLAILYSIFYHN